MGIGDSSIPVYCWAMAREVAAAELDSSKTKQVKNIMKLVEGI
jgi:hypothetical protein